MFHGQKTHSQQKLKPLRQRLKYLSSGFSLALLLFFAFSLNSCFILNYSSLLFNLGSIAGGGGNAAAGFEDASELETDLYEDGPVDLPVTIAKLDAPDVEKVSVEVSEGNLSESADLVNTEVQYQVNERTLIINGSSGAVDVEKTPNLIAYELTSAGVDPNSEVVVEAEADGAFQIRIGVDSESIERGVMFAGATADLSQSSSYLKVIPQIVNDNGSERRNFVIVTTNATNLMSSQNVMADTDGYYYLSLDQGGGTRAFIRRNLDGTEVEVLAENSTEAEEILSVMSDQKISYVNSAAELKLLIPSSAGLGLVTGDPLDIEIVSFEKNLTTLSDYDADATTIQINSDEDAIIVTQFAADHIGIDYIRTVSGSETPIIQTGFYDDMRADFVPDTEDLYAYVLFEDQYILHRTSLTSNVATAWGNRETLEENSGFTMVHSIDASGNDVVVIDAEDASNERALYLWDATDGLVQISDPTDGNQYFNPKISSDGSVVIACTINGGSGNQLSLFKVGETEPGTMLPLTNEPDNKFCDENLNSFYIAPNSIMHFYRSESDGSLPQHSLINLVSVE